MIFTLFIGLLVSFRSKSLLLLGALARDCLCVLASLMNPFHSGNLLTARLIPSLISVVSKLIISDLQGDFIRGHLWNILHKAAQKPPRQKTLRKAEKQKTPELKKSASQ
jgi:hypothetical protein